MFLGTHRRPFFSYLEMSDLVNLVFSWSDPVAVESAGGTRLVWARQAPGSLGWWAVGSRERPEVLQPVWPGSAVGWRVPAEGGGEAVEVGLSEGESLAIHCGRAEVGIHDAWIELFIGGLGLGLVEGDDSFSLKLWLWFGTGTPLTRQEDNPRIPNECYKKLRVHQKAFRKASREFLQDYPTKLRHSFRSRKGCAKCSKVALRFWLRMSPPMDIDEGEFREGLEALVRVVKSLRDAKTA